MAALQRPMRSERGPKTIWPIPTPRNTEVMMKATLAVVRVRGSEVASDHGT